MPEIEVIIVEDREPLGPYGAKGIGEPALIPTAPAILGAIHHATGVRLTRVPATPDRGAGRPASARQQSEMSEVAGKDSKDGIITCDACPVLCRIRPGQHRRLRPLRQCRWRADPHRPHGHRLAHRGKTGRDGAVPRAASGAARCCRRRCLRHRHRRRHHLSRLQARALHRLQPASATSTWSRS